LVANARLPYCPIAFLPFYMTSVSCSHVMRQRRSCPDWATIYRPVDGVGPRRSEPER